MTRPYALGLYIGIVEKQNFPEDGLVLKVLYCEKSNFFIIVYNKVCQLEHIFVICNLFSSRLYHKNIEF